jgi:putative restriction endonuclease
MPNENKRINIFFSRTLGAPLRNARWSWGAISPTTGQLFLRIWEDQRKTVDGVSCFLILRGKWRSNSEGTPERHEHIELMKRGARAFGVVQVAERTGGGGRVMKSFNSHALIRFGRLIEKGDSVYATIAGQVPVAAVEGRNRIPGAIEPGDDWTEEEIRALVEDYL